MSLLLFLVNKILTLQTSKTKNLCWSLMLIYTLDDIKTTSDEECFAFLTLKAFIPIL